MLSDEGRELLAMYRRAETGRSGVGSFYEIRCRVVKVDRSKRIITLRSVSGNGGVVVTVSGGELSRGLSPGDEIILTMG